MSSKKNHGGDERFLRVQKDPRFWEMPDRERKIKIDKRFQSMFHDERFKVRYTVDKRGRPINHTSTEDLKRFYKLEDSEDDEGDDSERRAKKKAEKKKTKPAKEKVVKEGKVLQSRGVKGGKPELRVRAEEDEDEDEEDEDDKDQQTEEEEDGVDLGHSVSDSSEEEEEEDGEGDDDDDDVEEEKSDSVSRSDEEEESGLDSEEDSDSDSGPDLARGRGNIETSSDEDDDDDDVDVDAVLHREEEEIEHDWGELCKDAPRSDEVSARLAVCNMDWDRLKAKDLLALLNSFTPKGGAVLSVKIYPSEFGKERLQTEEMQGPLELKALPDDSEDDTEEEKVYREKMRDYQFKRLKYFYAVVECDSAATAAKIYEECDGFEYESSCSVLDLRFIPDDVKFDDEPKDVATDVNLGAYTPKVFTSSATATSKVQLTWDETDHERVTALNRKFNKDELLEMDFTAYLASSSDEDEGDDGDEAEDKDDKEQVVEEVKKPQQEEKKQKKSEETISKYRELLKGIQDKEKKLQEDKDMEMEITWVPGLKETAEQLVKKKLEGKDKLTPWEEYLQKKKEKKKQKKSHGKEAGSDEDLSDDELPADVDLSDPFFTEELGTTDRKGKEKRRKKKQQGEEERTAEEEEELEKQKAEMALLMEDDTDEAKHKHFNYDKIVEQQNLSKKKRKKLLRKGEGPLEDDDFQVNVQDPRFQAMFTSHLFNLDPSHPSYKKTKATERIQAEKQRRREREEQQRSRDVLGAQKAAAKRADPAADVQDATGKTDGDSAASTAKKPMDPSLSLLVKSIKSKTEQFQARKKPKLV